MSISSDLIIDQDFADHLAYGLAGTETVYYYIHDENNSSYPVGLDGYGYTLEIPDEVEDYMASVFDSIDKYIDLDFTRVYTDNGSELDIYSLYSHTGWDSNTVGTAYPMYYNGGYWFDIAWKPTGSNLNNLKDFDKNTIIHEIGHSLGLDHPDGYGYNPAYTSDDTVMSYNIGLNGWSVEWTQSDIDALVSIWGEEDDNFASTDSNDTLTGTESNDSLTGTDSAEIISGLYGDDYIDARAGDDSLIGGSGNDTIYAGSGNDELTGGTGIDNLYGESGHDRFFISTGDGYDIIEDFIPGEDDIYSQSTIGLRTRIYKNEHLLIYSGNDLMAGIRGGADFNLTWDANILS